MWKILSKWSLKNNLQFIVLPKDTTADCDITGFELQTFYSLNNLLCLLSCSRFSAVYLTTTRIYIMED